MDSLSIQNIQKIQTLTSELEFERASSWYLQLRKLEKEDPAYEPVRRHLRELIRAYEQAHWSDESKITDRQIEESDKAEAFVRAENAFCQKRKALIQEKLSNAGLNQGDLAKILGHRKGYMSELMNGLRPFSKDDLIVINRLFKIPFEHLIPAFINPERVLHIKRTFESLSNSKIRVAEVDFDLQLVLLSASFTPKPPKSPHKLPGFPIQ